MYNSISRHEKQAGLLIWKTIALRHPQENQQVFFVLFFFLTISVDGEGQKWVFCVFIWCDQAVHRRCWVLHKWQLLPLSMSTRKAEHLRGSPCWCKCLETGLVKALWTWWNKEAPKAPPPMLDHQKYAKYLVSGKRKKNVMFSLVSEALVVWRGLCWFVL